MSTEAHPDSVFFTEAPASSFWGLPQAMPTFLLAEPIDRLTEDEVPIDELEDSMWVEAQIAGGVR